MEKIKQSFIRYISGMQAISYSERSFEAVFSAGYIIIYVWKIIECHIQKPIIVEKKHILYGPLITVYVCAVEHALCFDFSDNKTW